jgi:site-specific recombinase XerD
MEQAAMDMAPDLTKAGQTALVKAVARRIAKEAPALEDLDAEGLEKLAKAVVVETLKDDLKARAKLEKIDYYAERETFLARKGSVQTRRAYTSALEHLEMWCKRQGITVMEVTPALADDWIESEKGEGSPSTVRLRVSGCSAFFTWMERRHAEIRNPFRGTKSRPPMKATRMLAVPSEAEVASILEEAKAKDVTTWAAILLMARLGLRVGALPDLSITGDHYVAVSKGKDLRGEVSEELRQAITKAGLPLRSPFAGLSTPALAERVREIAEKMHAEGKLKASYSAHDLRHSFAVQLYEETRDVYAVKTALSHANVTVTETYLRSLGLEESQQTHARK